MCGRYTTRTTGAEIAEQLDAKRRCASSPPRYNIAPTQYAPVLLAEEGSRYLDMYRWGLIPSWAKEASIGSRLINARSETVAEKPSFRSAFRRRRCLIPLSGFFEWQATPAGKVPHWIHPVDGTLLTGAGLWEEWRPGDAEPIRSFTLLTTEANRFMQPLHERMPVVIGPEDREVWLDPDSTAEDLQPLLRSAPEELLRAHAVSTRVNRPAHDGPELIEPLPRG